MECPETTQNQVSQVGVRVPCSLSVCSLTLCAITVLTLKLCSLSRCAHSNCVDSHTVCYHAVLTLTVLTLAVVAISPFTTTPLIRTLTSCSLCSLSHRAHSAHCAHSQLGQSWPLTHTTSLVEVQLEMTRSAGYYPATPKAAPNWESVSSPEKEALCLRSGCRSGLIQSCLRGVLAVQV